MCIRQVEQVLIATSEKEIRSILANEDAFFQVDHREDDDAIVQYCEAILQTGRLHGSCINTGTREGFEIHIAYAGRTVKVPLTYSAADRHITIHTLNQLLSPHFEIRYCIDSDGDDAATFAPLTRADWEALNKRHGAKLDRHFYRIREKPILFTDSFELF